MHHALNPGKKKMQVISEWKQFRGNPESIHFLSPNINCLLHGFFFGWEQLDSFRDHTSGISEKEYRLLVPICPSPVPGQEHVREQ